MEAMKTIKKDLPLHVMMLPAVIILVIFSYIPMSGIVLAFVKYMPSRGFFRSDFVGLENFISLFTTPGFGQALSNTVSIALMKMVTGLAVPVVFALLLNEARIMLLKRFMQSVIYLPHFISWVLMAGIISNVLSPTSGFVNQLLGVFGFEPVFFLGDNKWFQAIVVITNVWKDFGWGTIIYLAALTSIDIILYEAAIMDGAGYWKQMLHITIPGLVPTIVLIATLSLGSILNAGFDQIFNLYTPMTLESGDIIDTLVYRLGIQAAQFSVATAAGLFKAVISCILIVFSYKLAYRLTGYKLI